MVNVQMLNYKKIMFIRPVDDDSTKFILSNPNKAIARRLERVI